MAKQRRKLSRCQREEAEQARLAAEAAAAKKRVKADPAQMVIPANTHFTPPEFYEDIEFTCRGCDSCVVWAAADQKWWYEVANGSIYAQPILCNDCREAKLARHGGTPRRSHAQRQQPRRAEPGDVPDCGT